MGKTVDPNVEYLKFEKDFIYTLNKHAPKATELFRGSQKSHVKKVLRSAIIKGSGLKNKANETCTAVGILYNKNNAI